MFPRGTETEKCARVLQFRSLEMQEGIEELVRRIIRSIQDLGLNRGLGRVTDLVVDSGEVAGWGMYSLYRVIIQTPGDHILNSTMF